MAENVREENAEGTVKVSLCGEASGSSLAVKRHLVERGKEHLELEKATKLMEKAVCPYCGERK